jgi:hypothetical protein
MMTVYYEIATYGKTHWVCVSSSPAVGTGITPFLITKFGEYQDSFFAGPRDTYSIHGPVFGVVAANCGITGNDIEIYQAAVELRDGRAVLPADPGVEGEARAHTPIIRKVEVIRRGAEVLVGVAAGNGASVGDAEQEAGEIVACRGSGEGECAARIVLRKIVELLSLVIGADRKVVRRPVAEQQPGDAAGLVAIERLLGISEARDAAGEIQRGRSPVLGLLVVAGDPSFTRHVFAVREVWRGARGKAVVLESKVAVGKRKEREKRACLSAEP